MHGDHWKRFLHAYVIGWAYIVTLANGMLWIILLHFLVRGRGSPPSVASVKRWQVRSRHSSSSAGLGFVAAGACSVTRSSITGTHPDAHNATLNPTLAHKVRLAVADHDSRQVLHLRRDPQHHLLVLREEVARDRTRLATRRFTDTLRIVAGPAMISTRSRPNFLAFDVLHVDRHRSGTRRSTVSSLGARERRAHCPRSR